MRDGRVLIVCRANVCRSPLAEMILTTALIETPISVESAGVAAVDLSACQLVVRWDESSAWHDRIQAHRPRQADGETVSAADLILAMSVSVRSELARLTPASRHKLFTLTEAMRLGVGFTPTQLEPYGAVVSDYAAYLDRRRTQTTGLSKSRSRWLRHRPPKDPLSIPDNHGRNDRLHLDTLRQVAGAASTIARQLSGDSITPEHSRGSSPPSR